MTDNATRQLRRYPSGTVVLKHGKQTKNGRRQTQGQKHSTLTRQVTCDLRLRAHYGAREAVSDDDTLESLNGKLLEAGTESRKMNRTLVGSTGFQRGRVSRQVWT